MLKISVIGLGNAGNQVAKLAGENGFPTIALNSSDKDLATVRDYIPTVMVGDEKGAGKDRSAAKGFMKEIITELIELDDLKKVVDGMDVVVIASSTGGGTGSGMGPVFQSIMTRLRPEVHFVLASILPPLSESVAAQQNSLEYLTESQKIDLTYLSYDNEQFSHLTTPEMMTSINQKIISDLKVLRGDYQFTTPFNSIDEKDMMKIIRTPGRLVVASVVGVREKDISQKSFEQRLIDDITNGGHTELETDRSVKRLGIITNLTEKLYKTLDTTLPQVKGHAGEPIEGFEHICVSDNEPSFVGIAMSGLSFPDDRIAKIVQKIEDTTKLLNTASKSSILDSTDLSALKSLRKDETTKKEESAPDVLAMFDDYQ